MNNNIVMAFAMPHTPGLSDGLELCPKEQLQAINNGFSQLQNEFDRANPDIVIALCNDHFDQYWMNNMPTFSVGVADTHFGPSPINEKTLMMKRGEYQGDEEYAKKILAAGIQAGFGLTRSGACEFNHNVLLPKRYVWPNKNVPVVPVMINCFSPPLPTWKNCYELGQVIRTVIDQEDKKVAVLASGGLSHWPPYVHEDVPADDELLQRQLKVQREGPEAREKDPTLMEDFFAREKEMSSGDEVLINIPWDEKFIDAFVSQDLDYLFSQDYATVEKLAGNGGHEMAIWMMLMGIMGDSKAEKILYEPVKEWMGGVGLVSYQLS